MKSTFKSEIDEIIASKSFSLEPSGINNVSICVKESSFNIGLSTGLYI